VAGCRSPSSSCTNTWTPPSSGQFVTATLGQNSIVIKQSDWIVLTQTPAAGQTLTSASLVHLGVVKLSDPKAAGITPNP
jgi:hypothetical protein